MKKIILIILEFNKKKRNKYRIYLLLMAFNTNKING